MTFKKSIFWLHLVCGVVAGAIIAIMSATGVAIAFESDIVGWLDRDAQRIEAPPPAAAPLPLERLLSDVAASAPEFKTTAVEVPREPGLAYTFRAGRDGYVFVDPYTAEARAPRSGAARDFLGEMESWHRWLGMEGDGRATGKLITGVSNLAFLVLCITGLYLWFPRQWNWRSFRSRLWFAGNSGKARDFNWHNVFGFWSLPVLVVLVATATVFSFGWSNRLVYSLAGEEAPARRGPGAPVPIEPPEPGSATMGYDAILQSVTAAYPDFESIALTLPRSEGAAALEIAVVEPRLFAAKGRIQISVDPYRGEILSSVRFEDRSRGSRARTWVRYLHTGEAFGLIGKIVATLATAASLILVYTGFALAWRRFFGKRAA